MDCRLSIGVRASKEQKFASNSRYIACLICCRCIMAFMSSCLEPITLSGNRNKVKSCRNFASTEPFCMKVYHMPASKLAQIIMLGRKRPA